MAKAKDDPVASGEPDNKPAAASAVSTQPTKPAEPQAKAAAVDNRPWWHVLPLCPTPVEPAEAKLQAANEQEAETEFRRLANLPGSVSGGFRITKIEK